MNIFTKLHKDWTTIVDFLLITKFWPCGKFSAPVSSIFLVYLSFFNKCIFIALHGYGQVITSSLASYNQSYEATLSDQPHSGWFSSITSMVGNMFVSDDGPVRPDQLRACNFALLALYEAVHLNR